MIVNNALELIFCQGRYELMESVFSADYTAHSGDKNYKGHKFILQYAKQLRAAIPDLKILKIQLLSETETIISWQRTLSGTHKAGLKGIPASGNKVKWCEMVVSRFEKGKIMEEWLVSELAFQLLRQKKP